MKYSLASKPGHPATETLDVHVRDLARGGPRLVGIAEIGGAELKGILPDGEGEDTVKLRLRSFEPALGEDAADQLRRTAQAMKALRTAEGTLTGDMDVDVAEHTLKRLAGLIGFEEAARLKVGVRHWLEILYQTLSKRRSDTATVDDVLGEVKLVAMGLDAVLAGVTPPADPLHDDDLQLLDGSPVDTATGEITGEPLPGGDFLEFERACLRHLAVIPDDGREPFGVRCSKPADHEGEHAGLGPDDESYEWPNHDDEEEGA